MSAVEQKRMITSIRELINALRQATPAQREMLRVLEQIGHYATICEISQKANLHPNSARESLDFLYDLGLVTKRRQSLSGRGRPAWVYETVSPGCLIELHDNTSDLVETLFAMFLIDNPNAAEKAKELGQRCADLFLLRSTIPDHSRFPKLTSQDQIDIYASKLRVFLAGQGFVSLPGEEPGEIDIQSCPYAALSPESLELYRIAHLEILRRIVTVLSRGAVRVKELPTPPELFSRIALVVE